MSISNRERVGQALDSLREELYPFVEQHMKATYGDTWGNVALGCLPESYVGKSNNPEILKNDVGALLVVMWEQWNNVFRPILGKLEPTLVNELRITRNNWAHNSSFTIDDTYHAFDNVSRLLSAVAGDISKLEKHKQELLSRGFQHSSKQENGSTIATPTEGQPLSGLKSPQEMVTSHSELASVDSQQAEFPADLWQVYLDEGSNEYRVREEIVRRIKLDKSKGEFSVVYITPHSCADVNDDYNSGVCLVILDPRHHHTKSSPESPARLFINDVIHHKGSTPRYCKNMLVFLAGDHIQMKNLEKHVAEYLAWNSMLRDKEILHLDVSQASQATTKQQECDRQVDLILYQTYQWLLIPTRSSSQDSINWIDIPLCASGSINNNLSLVEKTSGRVLAEGEMVSSYSAKAIREVLDAHLWCNLPHIDLQRLWEYFTQYLYLPRLKNSEVLLAAITEELNTNLWSDYFVYSQGWDEQTQRYIGLHSSPNSSLGISSNCLLVKPEVAKQQLEEETVIPTIATIAAPPKTLPRRFYGSIDVDALRINQDANAIANEVIEHLIRLKGVNVKISLEIEADIPDGVPDEVVRIITENCSTLKFDTQSFQ